MIPSILKLLGFRASPSIVTVKVTPIGRTLAFSQDDRVLAYRQDDRTLAYYRGGTDEC